MARYRSDDPSDELGAGIESLGGSIASIISSRKERSARQEVGEVVGSALDAASTPDEDGKPQLDLHNPKAIADFIRSTGKWDHLVQTGSLGAVLTLIGGFAPPEPGETWSPFGADKAAIAFGGDPKHFESGGWEISNKSGAIRQITRPSPAQQQKAIEAPTMRTVDAGDEAVTYQWDPASGRWQEFARGMRWQPERAKDQPETFADLSAAEKAALEEASGMPAGSLAGTPVQRNRVTGRLVNLPPQLDVLSRLLMGGAPAVGQQQTAPAAKSSGKGVGGKFRSYD